MKHYFIINPTAGGGKFAEVLIGEIREACQRKNIDYEVYITEKAGGATEFVREICQNTPSETELKFFSCGGDGTNYEVISGAVGYDNAKVGFIPSGTGNDFIRCFNGGENFGNIDAQLDGECDRIDLIRCNDRYIMNMMNTGFDCEVARKAATLKKYPLISSSMAYIMGVVVELIKKPTASFKISVDGGEFVDYPALLLATFSNGRYCGGGFKAAPRARLRSGSIDVCLIKNITRARFVGIVGKYRSGEYLFDKKLEDIFEYFRAKKISIDFGKLHNICIDGEIFGVDKLTLEILPKALNIIIPKGASFAEDEDEGASVEEKRIIQHA